MHRHLAVAVFGASGRMGLCVLDVLAAIRDVDIAAAVVRPESASAGKPLPASVAENATRRTFAKALPADVVADVLIDFSAASAFDAALDLALERRIAFVSGTTGLSVGQQSALDAAAMSIPVLWSANFSLGVALLSRLAATAARILPDWDCEIAEAHHSRKQDAPSGTAIALGREIAAARGEDFDAVATPRGGGRREPGSIGFAVTRAGDIVGEHTVLFAGEGERLELCHKAGDRAIFARGAVAAARWLAGRACGRYTLTDVLGAEVAAPRA